MIEILMMLPLYFIVGVIGLALLALVTFPILFFLYYLFISRDISGAVASMIVGVILYVPGAAFVIYCINHPIFA